MGATSASLLIADFEALPPAVRRQLRDEYLFLLDDGMTADDVFCGWETALTEILRKRLHELKARSGQLLAQHSDDGTHFTSPSRGPSMAATTSRHGATSIHMPETVHEPLLPPIVATASAPSTPWTDAYLGEIEVAMDAGSTRCQASNAPYPPSPPP